jgi:hypothetical protein
MNTYNYIKHVMSRAASYTFSRMTFYLTIFNFCMLSTYMYDQTSIGEFMKGAGLRVGDMLLIILFTIFAISTLEYVIIGRDKSEDEQPEQPS